jgi:hypothetical protein
MRKSANLVGTFINAEAPIILVTAPQHAQTALGQAFEDLF